MAQQVLVTVPLEAQLLSQDDDHFIIAVHKHPESPEIEHGDNIYLQLVFLERQHDQLQEFKPWPDGQS